MSLPSQMITKRTWEEKGGEYSTVVDPLICDFILKTNGKVIAQGIYASEQRIWDEIRCHRNWVECDKIGAHPIAVSDTPQGPRWLNLNRCDISGIVVKDGKVIVEFRLLRPMTDLEELNRE